MKNILTAFFALLSTLAFSQALDQFNGSLLIYSYSASSDTGADFRIQAIYGDARGFYTGAEVLVGDLVFIGRNNTCAPYEVKKINMKGVLMDLELKDITDWGTPSNADAIITHLTPNRGYPMIPPEGSAPSGNSNTLRACVMDHLINLLDLEDEVADTDTIYAAYSKLQGDPIDSIRMITRNDTFNIYTSDPVIQVKGQNGLNSSTDTVKLGGVLIEQTYVNSYNPDDGRGYTMQFDYTGDDIRDNYIRLDSLGQIYIQTKDTAGVQALVNEFFQRNGRKYQLTQISDDRDIWFENVLTLEDRNFTLINKDSTTGKQGMLIMKDGLESYLQVQDDPLDYFRISTSIVDGRHRGIYLIDSTARASNVIPGAVWTATNNVGGGKWSTYALPDMPPLQPGYWVIAFDSAGVSPSYISLDTLLKDSIGAGLEDGNGIYSGSDSLTMNTVVNGKEYDLTFSSIGDIRLGDLFGTASGQLLTFRNDVGIVTFTGIDSMFSINGIEYAITDPTTSGFSPGNYLQYVDESGDNPTWVNLDSLLGGSPGGGGGSDGNGIYSGSGVLPGNVIVTGSTNNFTISSTGNVTFGNYPTDNYLRTVGGTNQIDIKGSGGTNINGIAYHTQDAQTGGDPAGTYLTTHNETGGNVSWLHVDSLNYLKVVPDSAFENGIFDADNDGATIAINEHFLFDELRLKVESGAKYRIESRPTASSYLEIDHYPNPGAAMNLTMRFDSVKVNGLNMPTNTPTQAALDPGLYVWAYDENGGRGGTGGHYPVDSLLGNFPVTDPLFFTLDGNTTFIDQNNNINDTLNFSSFLAEAIQPDGNGIFSASNDGESVAVDIIALGGNSYIAFNGTPEEPGVEPGQFSIGKTSGDNHISFSGDYARFEHTNGTEKNILRIDEDEIRAEMNVGYENEVVDFYVGTDVNPPGTLYDAYYEGMYFSVGPQNRLWLQSFMGIFEIPTDPYQSAAVIQLDEDHYFNMVKSDMDYFTNIVGREIRIWGGDQNTGYVTIGELEPASGDPAGVTVSSSSNLVSIYANSVKINRLDYPDTMPTFNNAAWVWSPDGSGQFVEVSSSPLSIDSLFLQIGDNDPTFIDQTDGITDVLNIADSIADSRVQYALSYMTGGQNGDVDTAAYEPLNLTINGNVDTVIASTEFSVLSDGSIVFNGTTGYIDIEADISTIVLGNPTLVYFALTRDNVIQERSRTTVSNRGGYAFGHISYSLSVMQGDTINVGVKANLNNCQFIVDDFRLKLTKLR